MDFETKDRLNDVERRTSRLEDDISTMPSTIPTTLSSGASIILGRTTAAVSGSTFSIDGVQAVSGEDPTGGNTSTTVPVANTFDLTLANNALVFAIKGPTGWETWRPGESGGNSPERFVMIADKAAGDELGEARLLISYEFDITVPDQMSRLALVAGPGIGQIATGDYVKQTTPSGIWQYIGSDPSSSEDWEEQSALGSEIRIVDKAGHIVAYGPYVDAAGNGEESVEADPNADPPVEEVAGEGGFKGYAIKFSEDYDGTGFPGYYVVEIESLVPILYAKLKLTDDDLKPVLISTDPLSAGGSGTQNRLPKRVVFGGFSGADPDVEGFDAVDRYDLTEDSEENEEWGLVIEPGSDVYSYAFALKPVAAKGAGLITTKITAASFDNAEEELTYGKGAMRIFRNKIPAGGATEQEIADAKLIDKLDSEIVDVFTSVEEETPVNKIVQWEFYNGRRVVDVEPCKTSEVY